MCGMRCWGMPEARRVALKPEMGAIRYLSLTMQLCRSEHGNRLSGSPPSRLRWDEVW